MPASTAIGDTMVIGPINPVESKAISVPSHAVVNEKLHLDGNHEKSEVSLGDEKVGTEINAVPAVPPYDDDGPSKDDESDDNVIIDTAALAAQHLLPLRDDRQPSLTFRSMFLASGLCCFQAVMNQIYQVC